MNKLNRTTLKVVFLLSLSSLIIIPEACNQKPMEKEINVSQVFARVRTHEFHPLNEDNSLTIDRNLKATGVADLDDDDWRVRLLAVRDLVRAGLENVNEIKKGLKDESIHVRQVSAMALGILRAKTAIEDLEQIVREDEITMVRSQAIIALGQIESKHSLTLLRETLAEDPSRDIQHQCELAIDQIEKQMGTTEKQLAAFLSLDESSFESFEAGSAAPDFVLEDTDGKEWQLQDFRDKKWVILIWVFADWCPVCHGEFRDLMKMQEGFENEGVQVFTLETHDTYRGRVMVGKELDPTYWFSKESFQKTYTEQIHWPHLLDRAGAIAAIYGVDPMTFAVHAEYINRPTTVIIDKDGVVQLSYKGTFWGDRPTIEETLEMIKTEDFSFVHPKRLKDEK
ncbi:MAG: redoxin domain-containing protein [Cyclobacteriaceae bacterium]|nr:redoxin domain-containing protein [Cyclobacteriaceae bacterium]